MSDPINHPEHYTAHPTGVECIEITRHCRFNTGSALKYLWRAWLKHGGDPAAARLQDLSRAIWYVRDERALRARFAPAEPWDLWPVPGAARRVGEIACAEIVQPFTDRVALAFACIWDADVLWPDVGRLEQAQAALEMEVLDLRGGMSGAGSVIRAASGGPGGMICG